MSIELKPCPFCGGEAHMSASSDGYGVQCWSRRCLDMQMEELPTEEAAIEAWNTRAVRTCRLVPTRGVKHYPTALMLDCSECGTRFKYGEQPEPGEYCRGCGAKVVE